MITRRGLFKLILISPVAALVAKTKSKKNFNYRYYHLDKAIENYYKARANLEINNPSKNFKLIENRRIVLCH